MPVEENFDCRRKRVLVHRLDIPCSLKFKLKKLKLGGCVREVERVRRRLYHKSVDN